MNCGSNLVDSILETVKESDVNTFKFNSDYEKLITAFKTCIKIINSYINVVKSLPPDKIDLSTIITSVETALESSTTTLNAAKTWINGFNL